MGARIAGLCFAGRQSRKLNVWWGTPDEADNFGMKLSQSGFFNRDRKGMKKV